MSLAAVDQQVVLVMPYSYGLVVDHCFSFLGKMLDLPQSTTSLSLAFQECHLEIRRILMCFCFCASFTQQQNLLELH